MTDLPYQGKIARTFNVTITDLEQDPYKEYSVIFDEDFNTFEEAQAEAKRVATELFEDSNQEKLLPFLKFAQVLDQPATFLSAYKGWQARCADLLFEIYMFDRPVMK